MKGLQCLSHEINTSYSTVRRNCGFIEENVWKQRALNSALNTDFHLAHGTGFEWLPLSQDLTPGGFFLCGYLRVKLFNINLRTVDNLKETTQQEVFQSSQKLFKVYYGISLFYFNTSSHRQEDL